MAPKKPTCPTAKQRKYPVGNLMKKGKRLKCHGCNSKGKTYQGDCDGCLGTGYIEV